MFGYVRPLKGELKVKEFEHFKAVYCGLCHTLQSEYGFFSRMILNYDFAFLALLLDSLHSENSYCYKRCIASPAAKKCVCKQSRALELAAAESVILTYWKLCDNVADGGGIKKAVARLGTWLLRSAYRKAVARLPDFDAQVQKNLSRLAKLQKMESRSIDETADTFAKILSCSVLHIEDDRVRRPLYQMLYHIGRWIYLADALDDFSDDMKSGNYNPLKGRFDLTDENIPEPVREYLTETASHSLNLAAAAFELIPFEANKGLIENIVCLGLPFVWRQVEQGTWNKKRNRDYRMKINAQ